MMTEQNEVTLFRTKHSAASVLRIVALWSGLVLYLYVVFSLLPEGMSEDREKAFGPLVILVWHLVRYLRTSLTITDQRLLYETGFIGLKRSEMALKEIDLQRLKGIGVTFTGGIVDLWGQRFPLAFVDKPLEIYQKIFEAIRVSPVPKIDGEVIRQRVTIIWSALAGAAVFFPIWPFILGRILDWHDTNEVIAAVLASFIVLPLFVGLGGFLGGAAVLLRFPRVLTSEQAVAVFTLDLHPGMSKFDRWTHTSCNGTYERILSWRYGRPIRLPR